jgi:hypothetical protein
MPWRKGAIIGLVSDFIGGITWAATRTGDLTMADTISVLVTSTDSGKGIFGSGPVVLVDIPVERLKASLAELVAKLRAATADLAAKGDGLSLKELEVGIELTVEGGVSLIGTAKASGTASLKLTFVHD